MSTMTNNHTNIPGTRKAALLLVQLGKERAVRVLQRMDEAEVSALMAEVASLDGVQDELMLSVMTEFVQTATARSRTPQGGPGFARQVLTESYGQERAEEMLGRLGGGVSGPHFRFLHHVDAQQAAAVLAEEHPQTIALVLTSLPSERGLLLLSHLPAQMQGDVAYRVATMSPASPDVIRQVELGLQGRMAAAAVASGRPATGADSPLDGLVEMLSKADVTTEQAILGRLEEMDADLAREVRDRMFTFEDITKLDDKAIQMLLREVDSKVLALALKGAGDGPRDKIFGNLSERAAANLAEEVELLGPQRMAAVEEARQQVVKSIRALEESGSIVLARGNESYVD